MKEKYYVANVSGGKDSMAMFLMTYIKGYPIDEVVFFDTGWEFDCMYKNIKCIEEHCYLADIPFTVLKPNKSFDYLMFEHPHKTRKGEDVFGYSWCGGMCRWGTTQKTQTINNHFKKSKYEGKEIYHYIGLAHDEPKRIAKNKDPHKIYPLNELKITEQAALDICIENGIDFKENGVCLYDILDRVSCWCCSNKNLKELKNYYLYLPEYWQKLKDYQSRTDRPFRRDGKTIFDLEKRFEQEEKHMCLGLASGYREPKEKLTVISCEKCGRSWQVTEAAAKHYNEYYKGICADCRLGGERKRSLLKEDPTEKFKETVCDEICRYPRETSSQEDLDNRCENCILSRVKKVELEG